MPKANVKFPPRRVPSDDYAVVVDGVEYHPHAGEWVEILGFPTVAESKVFWQFNLMGTQLDELVGVEGGLAKQSGILDDGYSRFCAALGKRIVDWNWTDDWGNALPKPDGTGIPIEPLHADEIHYLRNVVRGETAADRKNDSAPSESTSSEGDQSPTKPS